SPGSMATILRIEAPHGADPEIEGAGFRRQAAATGRARVGRAGVVAAAPRAPVALVAGLALGILADPALEELRVEAVAAPLPDVAVDVEEPVGVGSVGADRCSARPAVVEVGPVLDRRPHGRRPGRLVRDVHGAAQRLALAA